MHLRETVTVFLAFLAETVYGGSILLAKAVRSFLINICSGSKGQPSISAPFSLFCFALYIFIHDVFLLPACGIRPAVAPRAEALFFFGYCIPS